MIHTKPAQAPAPKKGLIITPPRRVEKMSGTYDGHELKPFDGRANAMDAFKLPSRFANTLKYKDGTEETL